MRGENFQNKKEERVETDHLMTIFSQHDDPNEVIKKGLARKIHQENGVATE